MKTRPLHHGPKAFTLVEPLAVIAVITFLAAVFLPAVHRSHWLAPYVPPENHGEEIGMTSLTFANEHAGKFPMTVSTHDGGSMEFAREGHVAGPNRLIASAAPEDGVAATDGEDAMMSRFNRHLATVLRRLIAATYLLLLLWWLFLVAWKLRQEIKEKQERRTLALLGAQTRLWQWSREKDRRRQP
jgi:hypothetical protein